MFGLLRNPATAEKQAILKARWAELDPDLRVPGQGFGQKGTGCGATIGIQPRCDFACTGCYLGKDANQVPALPTQAILSQLDVLRARLGPKGNLQITDGEVTLRPLPELLEILRYARAVGMVPMLMTHGDTLRRQPGMLERLMVEGGLTEISIHIDITQRGRDGYPVPASELDLMDLRDEFAERVRSARKSTGRPIRVATTLTVSRDNLQQMADVVRWMVKNRDAFRLISFQPVAPVGRTRKKLQGVTPVELWAEVSKATAEFGLPLTDEDSAEPLHFGHPACTRIVPMLAAERAGQPLRLIQVVRLNPEDVAIIERFYSSEFAGATFRDDTALELAARAFGVVSSAPGWFAGPVRKWLKAKIREELGTTPLGLAKDLLRGDIRLAPLTLTSHHFMGPAELQTDLGKQRLAACVFRLPHKGEMVSMCQMNAAGQRDAFYREIIEGGRRDLPPAEP
ncbi:MAG TPA: radical SAM protein [Thermoanaerobaculia bacterium]|nr:radical SAM protein [Thermoanaerobaculia bacterium]